MTSHPLLASQVVIPWSSGLSCLAGELDDPNLHLGTVIGPLSPGQLELWLYEELSARNTANNEVTISEIDQQVSEPALRELVRLLLVKNPIWRTTFHVRDGQPVQRINADFAVDFTTLDCEEWTESEYRGWLARELAIPFDLSKSVFRCCFLTRCRDAGPPRNLLVIFLPHIVADFSCVELYPAQMNRWFQEPAGAVRDALTPCPTFLDFAQQEAERLATERGRELRAYWTRELAAPPEPLALPFDHSRGETFARQFETVEANLPRRLAEQLRLLGRQRSATPYLTLLACYFVLLQRYTQAEDIVVGTPVSLRPKELREVIGLFANVLPVRIALSPTDTFWDVLEGIKSKVALARQHMHLPLGEMLRLSGAAGNSAETGLFQATFAWERIVLPEKNRRIAAGQPQVVRHVTAYQHGTNSGVSVLFYDDSRDFGMRWNFDAERFRRDSVQQMAENFAQLLEEIVREPARAIGQLGLLTPAALARVRAHAQGPSLQSSPLLIHQLFEAKAEQLPAAPALARGDVTLDYGTLNARANRLAHRLRRFGVGPDQRVAICSERGLDMVVAVLAVWKAGGAYVPIDPAYPLERQRHMLSDSAPLLLLCDAHARTTVADAWPSELKQLAVEDACIDEPEWNPAPGDLGREHLAYIIYTSGSTGVPKGVLLEHRGLSNLAAVQASALGAGPGTRVLQFASFSFDGWVFELALALAAGGELCLPVDSTAPVGDALLEVVARHQITHAVIPPAVLAALPEGAQLPSLRVLIASGEALSQSLVKRWAKGRRFINGYGPTETTVCATLYDCQPSDSGAPPIGRPIANTHIYLLNELGQPVPEGAPGELCIGGASVARGYLNRPELSAERFVADPFSSESGAHLYKTGDLGRWRADGNIEFLGRRDAQVKIRGFRVELGEIEARLVEHPAVAEAVVVAREAPASGKRLIAYYTASTEVSAGSLREYLASLLPEHMLPAAYVPLRALPLTHNGKLDRRALPTPPDEAFATRAYQPPQSPLELELAAAWSELLSVERVGRDDNFFQLGGHSLLAVTLSERLRARGVQVDVRSIFAAPTLAELASAVGATRPAFEAPPSRIPEGCTHLTPEMLPLLSVSAAELALVSASVPGGAANIQDVYPLAPLQEGVFFHHLLSRDGDAYLSVAELAFDSRARLDAFVAALAVVVQRHDVLRTSLVWEGCSEPLQVVWREAPLRLRELELDPSQDALEQLRAHFDPRRDRIDLRRAPLLRLCAAEERVAGRWLLRFALHHLAGDHTMLEVMQDEIRVVLAGDASQLAPALPFRQLVAQARLGSDVQEQRAFFRRLLADIDEPTAPFGLLSVDRNGAGTEEHRLELAAALSHRLRERARQLGVSTASLFHVAWALVLARLTGRENVVFGTVMLGRMQSAGSSRGMGLFINTLPARVDVDATSTETSVRRAHSLLADLMRHEHASLALAQRESLVMAPTPLFNSLLNYRRTKADAALTRGPRDVWEGVQILASEERSNYPIALTIDDFDDAFELTAQVDAVVDAGRLCQQLETALERLLDTLETQPQAPLADVDALPEAEHRSLLQLAGTEDELVGLERCVHELVADQARLRPNALALSHGDEQLSYGELEQRAERLAQRLRALGVSRDERVAILGQRSPALVVAMLAVLKAGGAYVPLDPAYPAERLSFMLEDCEPRVLLLGPGQSAATLALPAALPVVPLLEEPGDVVAPSDVPTHSPSQLAYVVFTSGSSGRPKGVAVEHRQLLALIAWHVRAFELEPGSRCTSLAGIGFDAAVWEIWPTLCSGGTLLMPNGDGADAEALLRWWQQQSLDVSFLPTPLAHYAFARGIEHRELRYLLVGGDSLNQVPSEAAFTLVNNYGPTETTVVATSGALSLDSSVLHIGRPIAGARVYILDARRRPVPFGASGELYIGGAGVARGYLRRPELTVERFLPDPFAGNAEARMYRTGDLGRFLPDGNIEFLGRCDFQVKIRGFRIELGEIEARLGEHPSVRDVVVVARIDQAGEARLVAYLTTEHELPSEVLAEFLRKTLPDYMVPRAYVRLGTLPLTQHGKVDRKSLPPPELEDAKRAYAAPEGETEEALAQIWRELLGASVVGRDDDFFQLGGHSLLATRLLMRVNQTFAIELQLAEVLAAPVLRAMSERVLDAQLSQFDVGELNEIRMRVME